MTSVKVVSALLSTIVMNVTVLNTSFIDKAVLYSNWRRPVFPFLKWKVGKGLQAIMLRMKMKHEKQLSIIT